MLLLLHSLGFIYIYIFVLLSLFPYFVTVLYRYVLSIGISYLFLFGSSFPCLLPPQSAVLLSVLRLMRRGFFFFFLVFINLFYLLGSVCSPLKHSCFTELNIYTEFNLWTFSPTDFSLIIFITVIYTSETKHNLINYSCHMKSLNPIKWCSWTCSALILPRMF